jgi:pimeloyl-ACP methyl ester carboxylesterase
VNYFKIFLTLFAFILITPSAYTQQLGKSESLIVNMLDEDKAFHSVDRDVFENLGWDVPDQGRTIKALADNSPGNTFDPRMLEALDPKILGFKPTWYEVRFQKYGLDWDITGLHLMPENPVRGLPTMVIVHGGANNFYNFLVNPLNNPGVGQYLAQKVPVLLVTIPGNYRHGGWTEAPSQREMGYLLDGDMSSDEIKVRNSAYTFQLVMDGVVELIEEAVDGDFVLVGHSTGGELPYMLHGSRLKDRMHGRILGWATGGTSHLTSMQDRWGYTRTAADYPPVDEVRSRPTSDYSGDYMGPLNPVWDDTKSSEEVAQHWMGELVYQRRPRIKQVLQDVERRGSTPGMREGVIKQVHTVLENEGSRYNVDVDAVLADLFAPMRAPVTGYTKIVLTAAEMDTGHWTKDNPEASSTYQVVQELRVYNPDIQVEALMFDLPMTHQGHIERPRQLAGALYASLIWLLKE